MLPRLSWKTLFYDIALPALAGLPPARADRWLASMGRVAHSTARRRNRLIDGLAHAADYFGTARDPRDASGLLAENIARFLARDYLLGEIDDERALDRFVVEGFEHLEAARSRGRGVVLVGSHLGAHVAAVHWLFRRGIDARLMVQRPAHVSRYLQQRFDQTRGPHPQAGLFVRRHMRPEQAAETLLRSWSALRDGVILYTNGDVPWKSPRSRVGSLLGVERRFLALWAELATSTSAPVVAMFATHLPNGRYSLRFDPPWTIAPGEETRAVQHYLNRLEDQIANHLIDAPAHLLWPCYREPAPVVRRAHQNRHEPVASI